MCSGSSTNCSSCITPYYLNGSSCVTGCSGSTYGYNYTCQNCSLNCALCTDANTCTSCATNYYLLNGTCRTSCLSGYYVDTTSNRCIQCPLPCLVCTNRTVCSSCQSPYMLSGTTCISNCSIGYYYNSSLSSCVNCSLPHCSYCTASGCLNCQSNYYSVYTNNILTNCTILCPTGSYGDSISMNCTNCFTNCLACSNYSWCNNCSSGTYLLIVSGSSINQCVPQCPLSYYQSPNNNVCQLCPTYCQVCVNSTVCTTCNGTYYLYSFYNGMTGCVQNCPTAYATPTLIDGTGKCSPCPSNCQACIDSNTCTQCTTSPYIIYNGQCIPSNCLNCQVCDFSSNICNTCNAGYYLYGQSCYQYCPDGYYGDNSTGICTICMTDCLLCSSASVCTLCITNYIFVNGSGCVNLGFLNFGTVGNMSGFTSNITQIVGTVYVATSAGPIAFGALTSTYGPMQFCQFMYLLGGSSGDNP